MTGIPARAAIRTRGNAQFDPYRASLGVLASAVDAGAQVFERSQVRRIDVTRTGVCVRTAGGTLDARRVIIATGYATREFRPLAGRFRMYWTYVLASERIRAKQRDELGLSDVMIWDTERPYHYARWTPDRRLLLGGGDRLVRPGPGRTRQFQAATAEVREYFESLLPALATIETASAWEGRFAMTSDSLPYVGPHRRYPGHWFALGYGGNGMTFGFLAARLLLERWQGIRSQDHQLFAFDRAVRG
jgi:glycine/D-amino acid oxidase-like deaminating enzyme